MRSRAQLYRPPPQALPGLPELTYVGRIRVSGAVRIGVHYHDGWELCLIERGSTHWIIDDRPIEVRGGQLVVIPPQALHDGWQPGRYRFLGLRVPRKGALLGLPREQAKRALAALAAAGGRSRPLEADLNPAWERLERAWNAGGEVAAIAARAALLEIVAAVAAGESAAEATPPLVARALEAFAASDEFLPVTDVAARLRCSASHLKSEFRRCTGLPPAEYHRRQRVARAWRELRRGERSVTEVAFAYGFPSSQHFATAFKRITGMTPSQARAANLSELDATDPATPASR